MSALSFPNDFSSGTTISSSQVNANFTAAETWSTTLSDDNFSSSAGMYAAYRTLYQVSSAVTAGSTAGDYLLANGGASVAVKETTDGNTVLPIFYLAAADFAVSGRSTKLRVRSQLYTNSTGPSGTLTVGLFPVSSVTGGGGVIQATLGAVVSGSTCVFGPAPGPSTAFQVISGDFTFPTDGHHALGVTLSGTTAVNSYPVFSAQLQQRWT